jgi:predicted dehydrogenase
MKYGMVGGGQGASIGDAHRNSIAQNGNVQIASGCFSRSYENTLETGKALGIAQDRLFKSFEEMAEAEDKRSDKIDFVVIVTPNSSHFAAAKAFLNAGIHVVCDKPLCWEIEEARELADLAKEKNLLFCVTYTYNGYSSVKQVRQLIQNAEIGKIRFVSAEYLQNWLARPVEKEGNKQAEWRLDPDISGKSNTVGDIGCHVENMVSYMTGLRIKSLCARLDKMVEGRRLDDNAAIMLEYESGAKGLYWVSQAAIGYKNSLRVRIFGNEGTIEWLQESPDYIEVIKPIESKKKGFYVQEESRVQISTGKQEDFNVAMNNIYKNFINALLKLNEGRKPNDADMDFPCAQSGLDSVRFINRCVDSSNKGAVWVDF